ncbi:hypothetical protein DDE83_001245 [Stemphylium lycopersici]|uniref:Protein-S-isoprenylcysteine O-methyltransferase n=1 Tax=Stemphylium lycopersici TaxID=183478 RepID=A0A364NDR7_STELY|nr:hypothetical protein DDE83_001245 [Stemphylium lycopersici]
MPPILPALYTLFLLEQAYALNIHFPHPPSGLVYLYSINLLKLFSATAGILAWTPLTLSHGSSPAHSVVVTGTFFLASLSLFTWTARSTRAKNLSVIFGRVTPWYVIDTGPYAYIRHPTYVSYALGWLAATVYVLAISFTTAGTPAAWIPDHMRSALLVAAVGGLLCLYRRGAMLEEAQFLQDKDTVRGEKTAKGVRVGYLEYVRRVGARWVPWVV